MKIVIEFLEGADWKVTYGDKYAERLSYDEMLSLVAAVTMPEKRPAIQWPKTKEQHKALDDFLKNQK